MKNLLGQLVCSPPSTSVMKNHPTTIRHKKKTITKKIHFTIQFRIVKWTLSLCYVYYFMSFTENGTLCVLYILCGTMAKVENEDRKTCKNIKFCCDDRHGVVEQGLTNGVTWGFITFIFCRSFNSHPRTVIRPVRRGNS